MTYQEHSPPKNMVQREVPLGVQGLSILIIGLGIGWLTGLSVTPVVSGVIASLLGLGTGVILGLQALKAGDVQSSREPRRRAIDPRPAALLVLGIAIGAPCGIFARTYKVFEPVQERRIETTGSPLTPRAAATTRDRSGTGGLFGVESEVCDELFILANRGDKKLFIRLLKSSNFPGAQDFISRVSDFETLKVIVEVICKKS